MLKFSKISCWPFPKMMKNGARPPPKKILRTSLMVAIDLRLQSGILERDYDERKDERKLKVALEKRELQVSNPESSDVHVSVTLKCLYCKMCIFF